MPVIYDFLWDDQGVSGVWVVTAEGKMVLVEASICTKADPNDCVMVGGEPYHEPTAEYVVAESIVLEPGDGVWWNTDNPVYGAAAQASLAKLVEISTTGTAVAVNEQQVALLGPDALRTEYASQLAKLPHTGSDFETGF